MLALSHFFILAYFYFYDFQPPSSVRFKHKMNERATVRFRWLPPVTLEELNVFRGRGLKSRRRENCVANTTEQPLGISNIANSNSTLRKYGGWLTKRGKTEYSSFTSTERDAVFYILSINSFLFCYPPTVMTEEESDTFKGRKYKHRCNS